MALDPDRRILTWFENRWQAGNVSVLGAADHGTWLGTLVFDGARRFDGVAPDLAAHCARVNRSAVALGMQPTHSAEEIASLALEGLHNFPQHEAVYIRPMYWSLEFGEGVIAADPDSTAFCLCLETIPMPAADASTTLSDTRFHRPTLDVATVDAKAACLYPNNARMVGEAISRGFANALVTDTLGNVAESATSNVFMVRDGEVFTPMPNGTFLNGITRQRVIALLRADGVVVHEAILSKTDFHAADEVFLTGNIAKVTPVVAYEETRYEIGAITRRVRELYFDWAHTDKSGQTVSAPVSLAASEG